MTSHTERIIVLVDMDCFYCQVEENLDPNLAGKPIAVVQYNAWKGGGIIAVNYPARDRGVTRHMRGNEAKDKCPEIQLVRVPNVRGKADLTKYREAGKRVAEVLQTFTPLLERASVDEAYMDITESVNKRISSMTDKLTIDSLKNTHVVGCETKDYLENIFLHELMNESNLKLAVGGAIVEEIRAAVYEKTGYRCSAGIAHNKILAKLSCGLHKPNKQTILPQEGIQQLYENLPLRKIKSLGGKFGNSLSEELNITNMGELIKFSERDLLNRYEEKTALWLYNIARGIDNDPVTVRLVSKSIGCCKKFPGRTALKTIENVTHWVSELATEISERLEQDIEENNRRAKQMVISFAQPVNRKNVHSSRTQILNSYEAKKIAYDAFETLKKLTQKADMSFNLTFLGISVGKFEDCKNTSDISTFFKLTTQNKSKTSNENSKILQENRISNTTTQENEISKLKIEDTRRNIDENIRTSPDNISATGRSKNISKFFSSVSPKIKQDDEKNDLNLSDIEEDAENTSDINLNETLKDMENIKSIFDDDEYADTTCEEDYTELLKTKEEFPNVSEKSDDKSQLGDTSKSFFMKYVKNLENNKIFETPTNFITTDQETPSCSYQQTKTSPILSKSNKIISTFHENSNSSSTFDEIESLCPECNKKIHKSEFLSHMDFHLAEKLMSEEREIFQLEFQAKKQNAIILKSATNSPKVSTNKAVKRKPDKNPSITSFFAKEVSKENIETQLCPDCDKRISVEDFECHLDYHAAKKLHLELNPVKIGSSSKSIVNKKKSTCKNTNSVSISNFFKGVEN